MKTSLKLAISNRLFDRGFERAGDATQVKSLSHKRFDLKGTPNSFGFGGYMRRGSNWFRPVAPISNTGPTPGLNVNIQV
jgi:hypothetical protein